MSFTPGSSPSITGTVIIADDVKIQDSAGNALESTAGALDVYQTNLVNGSATEAAQVTGNASLASIDSKLTSPIVVTTGGLTDAELRATAVPVTVSNFPGTQPISGTVAVSNFPATQTVAGSVAVSGTVAVSNLPTTQAVTQSTSPWVISGSVTANAGTNLNTSALALDTSVNALLKPASTLAAVTTVGTITNPVAVSNFPATQPISAASLPLPAGASTSALQSTGNTSLSSIDSKTPALGQALAAASVPIVLTALQLATLTPLASVAVSNFPATQPVSGTVAVTQSTSPWVISGSVTANAGTNLNTSALALDTSVNALLKPASTLAAVTTVGTITNPIAVSNFPATQPVSAASLPLPTGASTSALQSTGNTSLNSIDSKTPALGQALAAASTPVVLTAAQITTLTPLSSVAVTQSTSPWVISGSVTANAGTNLNTSALALDTSVNALLKPASTLAAVTTVGTITNPVAATQSGTWNITNISGTVSLPTGASTAANQTNNTQTTQIVDAAGISANVLSASISPTSANKALVVTMSPNRATLSPAAPTFVAVGVSSALAVGSNTSRKGLHVTNTSANAIYLSFGGTAVIGSGITLYPGGSFLMDDYCFSTAAVFAIASAASSNLAIQEFS